MDSDTSNSVIENSETENDAKIFKKPQKPRTINSSTEYDDDDDSIINTSTVCLPRSCSFFNSSSENSPIKIYKSDLMQNTLGSVHTSSDHFPESSPISNDIRSNVLTNPAKKINLISSIELNTLEAFALLEKATGKMTYFLLFCKILVDIHLNYMVYFFPYGGFP